MTHYRTYHMTQHDVLHYTIDRTDCAAQDAQDIDPNVQRVVVRAVQRAVVRVVVRAVAGVKRWVTIRNIVPESSDTSYWDRPKRRTEIVRNAVPLPETGSGWYYETVDETVGTSHPSIFYNFS